MKKYITLILLLLYLLDPLKLGYAIGYIIVLFVLFNLKTMIRKIDTLSVLLLVCTCIYSIFYFFNQDLGIQYLFIYAFFPFTFYIFSKYLFGLYPNLFKRPAILILLAFAFSFTSLISVGIAFLESGFNILNRNVINFWTGLEENATYTGGFFILNMSLPGALLISWRNLKIWQRISGILIFILSLLCVLRLGSRTQLLIAVFGLVMAVLYLLARQSAKKSFFMVAAIFLLLNVGLGYLSIDKDADFIAAYTDRMDSKKYGANTAGGRTERWEKSLTYLFEKPLGWDLDEFGYSHNLWFDALRVGGVIPFILLLVISFLSIKKLYSKLKQNKNINPILGILLVYIVSFNLLFLVEPIFEGYFEIFVIHCFFLGLLSAYSPEREPVLKKEIKTNFR